MAESLNALPARVGVIEQKLDALSASAGARFAQVDKRFDEVDKRFDEVTQQLVEQREYTEFAYERLSTQMASGFSRLERKVDQVIDAQSRAARRRPARRSRKR